MSKDPLTIISNDSDSAVQCVTPGSLLSDNRPPPRAMSVTIACQPPHLHAVFPQRSLYVSHSYNTRLNP